MLRSFLNLGAPLGLCQVPTKDWEFSPFKARIAASDPVEVGLEESAANAHHEPREDWINRQIENRKKARERKDFAEADKIRQDLASKGIILEDRPDGTTRWKR